MASIGLVVLSDTGLAKGRRTVTYNDAVAIKQMIESYSNVTVNIYFRNEIKNAFSDDMLIVAFGGVFNMGGIQSDRVHDIVKLINAYPKRVCLFNCDIDSDYENTGRNNFMIIKKKMTYISPFGLKMSKFKQLSFDKEIFFNQAYGIGKDLCNANIPKIVPVYDATYGGSPRATMVKRVQALIESGKVLVYGNIAKKVKGADVFKTKRVFSNRELVALTGLGRYSVMFSKPRANFITPRLFEQMMSESMVLFDRHYTVTKDFWTDDNTFDDLSELQSKIVKKVPQGAIAAQHQKIKNVDFDEIIKPMVDQIRYLI